MSDAASHNHLKYRPDIDGLRAIAVVSVVLYHAGVRTLSGGYVGVDIFFVISGFLITTILLGDQSITRFYLRRARRILPALFAVLAATLAGALVLMLPGDLTKASQSIVATLAFLSNMFFWRQSGYFAPDTAIMPLLHTWSLGVEEQYYIVFPWIIILLRRVSPLVRAAVFVLLALISLAAAVVAMRVGQANAAFYILPPRAWELLAGAILATGVIPPIHRAWLRAIVGLLGLALLAWPILLFTPATPFPGLTAVPPVLGSVFVIAAGNGGTHPVGRLLSLRPFVWIGLVSYSLYLWHWPILALARYALVRDLTPAEAIGAVTLTFLLAILSWRFVERPFRRRLSNRIVVLFSVSGAVLFLGASLAIVATHGLAGRFPTSVVTMNRQSGDTWKCPILRNVKFEDTLACPLTPPNGNPADADVILWGDSHAQMYAPALTEAAHGRKTLLINVYGCAPVMRGDDCGGRQGKAFAAIANSHASIVIMAQNWPQYRAEAGARFGREPIPEEEYVPAIHRMEETVAALRARGKHVVLIAPIPRPNYEVPSVVSRETAFFGHPIHPVSIDERTFRMAFTNIYAALDRLSHDPGVTVLDLSPQLCPGGNCAFVNGNGALFADYGHLSTDFSRTLAPRFALVLDSPAKP